MKKTVKSLMVLSLALAGTTAATFTATTFVATPASAETYIKREYVNRDRCFISKRIPQKVEVNTRGKLLRSASRSWSGNPQKSGSIVRDRYHDPVYLQTTRVVEEQHVTLVPVKCR